MPARAPLVVPTSRTGRREAAKGTDCGRETRDFSARHLLGIRVRGLAPPRSPEGGRRCQLTGSTSMRHLLSQALLNSARAQREEVGRVGPRTGPRAGSSRFEGTVGCADGAGGRPALSTANRLQLVRV